MKILALIAAALVTTSSAAMGDEVPWPELKPGEVKVLEKSDPVPDVIRQAAGFGTTDIPSHVRITLFRAEHNSDMVIISPCCGAQGAGASLFEHVLGIARPLALTVGDPRKGFTTQPFADAISVDDGAKALRARLMLPGCEDGSWGYYYQFDEIDRPLLVSVIDSCGHIGVRQLYHTGADVGRWWMHK